MSESDELDEIRKEKLREYAGEEDDEAVDAGGSGETPSEPIHVAGAGELDGTVADYDLVLADFYADWCGPCQMLEPVVEEIAAETDAVVAKVDVDANQQLAAQYGVRGVPTLVLFADGEPAEQLVGMQNKERLVSVIDQHS
ncbi:MAG: thioredoxin [Haloarculaceae archaeon]